MSITAPSPPPQATRRSNIEYAGFSTIYAEFLPNKCWNYVERIRRGRKRRRRKSDLRIRGEGIKRLFADKIIERM